ncbi:MAG: MATE family efflux transporter [Clostridia bacterium]|nr:MATE family efflux transporter [Clostridia bacterium]
MFKRWIGSKQFYRDVLALMIPIMIQNGITNFVNMLDNIMVGRAGDLQMSGVSIANTLFFVFNLCVFGAVSGTGIFGAQFAGKRDVQGLKHTFRFKIIFCTALALTGIAIFYFFGDNLIDLYLRGEAAPADAAAARAFSRSYMLVMLIGLLPHALAQAYASTLRETGQVRQPMYAGLIAVLVNLLLNYILIFGRFGAPKLGAVGAAVATVISRYIECLILIFWTGRHKDENPFIVGAWASLRIPGRLIRQIALKGLPLMLNETLWAGGMAMLSQSYSLRGLDVVKADNITQTFQNVFMVVIISAGGAIGIYLGHLLGANRRHEAKMAASQLAAFSVAATVLVAAVYAICAEWIPAIYETSEEVRRLATRMMQIGALIMPLDAYANAAYFTLRSGGQTFITILFDSCFMWVVSVPAAFVLSRFTAVPILPMYAICLSLTFLKDIIGFVLVNKGIWIRNIVK